MAKRNYRRRRRLPPVILLFPKRAEAQRMTTAQYVARFCILNHLKGA